MEDQIKQCQKDKYEYFREIRLMESDFKEQMDKQDSKHISDAYFLAREKHEALDIAKYKELYKMEQLKKEQENKVHEQHKKEKLAHYDYLEN